MASTQLLRELQEDVTCPICMEIMKEPVITNCGHNFCLRCISQAGEASENFLLCPLCKAVVNRTFQPNKLLERLMEKIQVAGKEVSEEQIQVQPQDMGQKDKEVVEEEKQVEGMIEACKAQVHQERLKIQEEFNRMRKNLEEEEGFLLARRNQMEEKESFFLAWCKNLEEKESSLLARQKDLEDKESSLRVMQKKPEEEHIRMIRQLRLEQEGHKSKEQHNIVTPEQLSSSRKLKQQMPPRNLLQGMEVPSSRRQRFQFTNPTLVPVDMEDRNNEATSRNGSTIDSLKKLTGCQSGENNAESPTSEERKRKGKRKKSKTRSRNSATAENLESWSRLSGENKAPVTLNPESADPELTLSDDLKTVSLQPLRGSAQNKQGKPRPFDLYHWVLGSQGISSGHLVWEVKLQGTDKGACVVGVATWLAPGQQCLNRIWALKVSDKECQPITESSARENFPIILKNVGIHLDCDLGKVVFFNPATYEHIYTFQESFTGEVFPFLGLMNSGSQMTLIP